MVNTTAYNIELWTQLGGLLSTQEARVALGYRLERLLRFFHFGIEKIYPCSNEYVHVAQYNERVAIVLFCEK